MQNKNKIRVSVTMRKTYVGAIDSLVEDGLYLSRGDVILEALRDFFEREKIEPFYIELEE